MFFVDIYYHMSQDVSCCIFFFQAEDGIRDLVRSRGLGDVYKRQVEAVQLHRLIAHESCVPN